MPFMFNELHLDRLTATMHEHRGSEVSALEAIFRLVLIQDLALG
jgi:hypothetical protein